MRLPVIASVTLLLSLGINFPVMSQSTVETAKLITSNNFINNLNSRRLMQ
jgi:hypothetical protein